jgi:hypothetical protein
MAVHPINPTLALRLVSPAHAARAPQAPAPADRARPAASPDSFSFEAIYRANLPRPALSDAHRRLERIRELVAARTDVPIHFQQPAPARAANPVAHAYLRFPAPSNADLNASATEQQVG